MLHTVVQDKQQKYLLFSPLNLSSSGCSDVGLLFINEWIVKRRKWLGRDIMCTPATYADLFHNIPFKYCEGVDINMSWGWSFVRGFAVLDGVIFFWIFFSFFLQTYCGYGWTINSCQYCGAKAQWWLFLECKGEVGPLAIQIPVVVVFKCVWQAVFDCGKMVCVHCRLIRFSGFFFLFLFFLVLFSNPVISWAGF